MKKIAIYVSILVVTPLVTMAAPVVSLFTISQDLNRLLNNFIIPLLVSLGVVYLIWGVLQFILGSAEEAKKEGRAKILNGLIGLFVIIAFWGIISLFTTTTGVGPTKLGPGQLPCIEGGGVICP